MWTEVYWHLVEAKSESGRQIHGDSFLFGTHRGSQRAWREAYAFSRREKFASVDFIKNIVAFIKIVQKTVEEVYL